MKELSARTNFELADMHGSLVRLIAWRKNTAFPDQTPPEVCLHWTVDDALAVRDWLDEWLADRGMPISSPQNEAQP